MKASSLAVACHIRHMESVRRIEDIPSSVIAWIALPLAVLKVSSEAHIEVSKEENLDGFRDGMSFLSTLGIRFRAARLVADMLNEATDTIVQNFKVLGLSRPTTQKGTSPSNSLDSTAFSTGQ